jgi:hypothetical protein
LRPEASVRPGAPMVNEVARRAPRNGGGYSAAVAAVSSVSRWPNPVPLNRTT